MKINRLFRLVKMKTCNLFGKDYKDYGVKIIGAPSEWKETRGSGIKVAILDTGIDFNHKDLKDRIKGGIDLTSDNPQDYMDRQGHGTHCAGVVGASLNGGGVAGIAPEVDIYAIKILGDKGTGSIEQIIDGIKWCVDNDMHIISMSLGLYDDDTRLHEVVKQAYAKNIVMIAAAGNDGDGEGYDNVNYPARYDEVIAVAAIDLKDKIWSGSSSGIEVEVASAGVDVLSTYPNNKYAFDSGTSMACPHIAGAVALIQSKALKLYKRLLTIDEIRLLLQMYSEDLGLDGRDENYGYGVFSFDRI